MVDDPTSRSDVDPPAGAARQPPGLRTARWTSQGSIPFLVIVLVIGLLASTYPWLAASTYRGSPDLHSALEVTGALIGMIAGIALVACFYALGDRFLLLVGLAFFVNGGEDLVHGLLAARNLFGLDRGVLNHSIPATYATGRIMLALLLLAAPWASRWAGPRRSSKRETLWVVLAVLAVAMVLTAAAFVIPLPELVFRDRLISRPVDFFSAVLLAAALIAFLGKYRRDREMLTWWIALSIGVNLVGQGLMSFSKTPPAPYDALFIAAHAYKLLGYMVPVLGFSLYQTAAITQRKRAEEALQLDESRLEKLLQLNQMTEASLQQITDFALEEAVRLTKSRIGYLAFTSEDETVLTMHSWSQTAMAECAIIDKPIVYPVETTGLWGEAIRQRKPVVTNDYAAPNPLKKGYPQGHVHVLRHMNVPVFDGRRIVAVAGVGNKDEPYDESDIRQLTLLMQGMWRLIQRRRAEEELQAGQARLRQIIDLVPHLIFAKDRDGRFLLANRAVAEAYGTTVEELIGKRDLDYHPPDEELNHFLANDRAVIDTGQPKFVPEEILVDVRGKRHVLQTTKIPFTAAGLNEPAVLGVAIDVSDLKQAEEELRQAHDDLEIRVQQRTAELAAANEELRREIAERQQAERDLAHERFLLRTLMDNFPDYIYFKDPESRFTRIGKALAAYFGLSDPHEAIGKTDADIYGAERAGQYLADEQEIMRTGRPILDKEEEQSWPDGRVTWVSTTKVPLRSPDGEVIGTFGISRDITDRKRAELQLQAAKSAAEAASRAKSVFLANMSHEIRTPMNAILGMTELVLDTPLVPPQREFLRAVQESGEALLAVINDILDFSKIEAGKLALDCAPFDLAESLGDTMKSLALRAHAKGLELAYHLCPEVPAAVVGDRARLRQVVVNLVGNAIKFTDAGEVVLEVAVDSSSDHEVVLHFAVSDTGIGIPEDKRAVIFDAFEQADNSTTRRFGGTGLGLAISSRLCEMMSGRIWVESEVGRGSTFHFTARFALAEEPPAPAPPAQPAIVGGTSVLVVDDNATNRRILEEMLRNWGMLPTAVPRARDALQLLREAHQAGRPFRLVLADASMPEMDGFSLTEQIKQDPQLGSTVIMMLSSADRPGDVSRCERLGLASYLLKPVKQSELLDAILVALGISAAEDEALEPLAAPRSARFRPLRILLAEDSLVNQKLAVGLLERVGHSVVVANNGQEALGAAESQPFDLVLMDVQMPEMDGLEATAAIRAREKRTGRHLPIIAMTAHAMPGDRQRCLEAGMDEYLAKPIRARQLLAMIETVLGAAPPGEGESPLTAPPGDQVDWLGALRAVQGDRDLLRSLAETALEEYPRLMGTIRQAIAGRDAAALRLAAHTLKGSIRHFGAPGAFKQAHGMEMIAGAGDFRQAEDALPALESEVARLAEALQHFTRLIS